MSKIQNVDSSCWQGSGPTGMQNITANLEDSLAASYKSKRTPVLWWRVPSAHLSINLNSQKVENFF